MVGGEGGGRLVKWTQNTCQERRKAQKGDLEKNNTAKMGQNRSGDPMTKHLVQRSALPIMLDSSAQRKIF